MTKNVVVIGLGPHARREYYPILERLQQRVRLVLDLEDQESHIRAYLAGRALAAEQTVFLPTSHRNVETLPDEVTHLLDDLHRREPIDRLLIATEPKAHKRYLRWALSRNIDVLVEKPLTAPVMDSRDPATAARILTDYDEVAAAQRASTARVVVMAPRRHHAGFRLIRERVRRLQLEFDIPVTHLDIYHADGMWNMPLELFERENHPYRYGYGKLMHSGYHHLDLLVWLSELNRLLPNACPDRLELVVRHITPHDSLRQVTAEHHVRWLGASRALAPPDRDAKALGELDAFIVGQFMRGDAVISTAVLQLLQTSVSARGWSDARDPMFNQATGRVSHERLTLQVGHLMNIQAHAYKVPQPAASSDPAPFRITIARNTRIVGGEPYEEICFSDPGTTSLTSQARTDIVTAWLEGRPTDSELADHGEVAAIMSRIYECMFRQNSGLAPMASLPLGRRP